jgi:signal transduction histidine kinase
VQERTVLTVSDDGSGFAQESVKTKGLGLRIMHYRAQKIGGALVIQRGKDGGTVVTCSFQNEVGEF